MNILQPNKETAPTHYYGDIVRKIFLACGLVMALCFPLFSARIIVPAYASIFGIIVLAFLAGLQSPRTRFVTILNFVAALAGCAVFQYAAITALQESQSYADLFMWINEALALAFFFAIYYTSKTLRNAFTQQQ